MSFPHVFSISKSGKKEAKQGNGSQSPHTQAGLVGVGLELPRNGAQSSSGAPPWLSSQGFLPSPKAGGARLGIVHKVVGARWGPRPWPLGPPLAPHSGFQLVPLGHGLPRASDHVLPVFDFTWSALPGQVDLGRKRRCVRAGPETWVLSHSDSLSPRGGPFPSLPA